MDTRHTTPPTTTDRSAIYAADPLRAPRWLRPGDAAAIAGVSRRTIDRWIRAGILRHSRPAGAYRVVVDRDALLAILDAGAEGPTR